jgi:hypothetical protein
MAELFARSDREEYASIARAEARRLFHGAPGLFSPFAVTLFEKVLALGAQQAEAAPAQQQQPAPEPAAERRSPGGLILP